MNEAAIIVRAKILAWVGHVAFARPSYAEMQDEVTQLAQEIVDELVVKRN